jgi:hypothetical protein
MLGWDRHIFDKMGARTCYADLVVLHPVRSAGHIVHYGASGARNMIALFLILG